MRAGVVGHKGEKDSRGRACFVGHLHQWIIFHDEKLSSWEHLFNVSTSNFVELGVCIYVCTCTAVPSALASPTLNCM